MKKLIIILMMILMATSVLGAVSVSRVMSESTAESTFRVEYTITADEDSLITIEDTISGPCNPKTKTTAIDWKVGEPNIKGATFTTTGKGTCTFTGVYGFATATTIQEDVAFPIQTIQILDDTPAEPVCENDVKEEGEQCDGDDFGDESCITRGFDSGTLNCIDCVIDDGACITLNPCTSDEDCEGDEVCNTDTGQCASPATGGDGFDLGSIMPILLIMGGIAMFISIIK